MQRGSPGRDGVACEIAAKAKQNKYPNTNVCAFVVEEHGRFGEDAMNFLRKVAPLDPALLPIALNGIYQT